MTLIEIIKIVNDTSLANSTRLFALENLMEKDGHLNLRGTGIEVLPEELAVKGDLDLRYTPIRKLPKGLIVGENLYLRYTNIKELPKDLIVGGYVYAIGTKIPNTATKPIGVKGVII